MQHFFCSFLTDPGVCLLLKDDLPKYDVMRIHTFSILYWKLDSCPSTIPRNNVVQVVTLTKRLERRLAQGRLIFLLTVESATCRLKIGYD